MTSSQFDALRQAVSLMMEANLSDDELERGMMAAAFSALLSRLSQPGYTMSPGEAENCAMALRVYISLRPETSGQQRGLLAWLSRNYGV